MSLTIINNEPKNNEHAKLVTHEKTKSLIPFKKFATQEGLNLSDKEEKKKANVLYTQCKRAYYAEGKAWAAFLNSQADLNVNRHAVTRDKDGNIKGAKISFRVVSKAESKTESKAKVDQTIEEQKQKIAELEAKLAALQS